MKSHYNWCKQGSGTTFIGMGNICKGWTWYPSGCKDVLLDEYKDLTVSSVFLALRLSEKRKMILWPIFLLVSVTQWESCMWMGMIMTGWSNVGLNLDFFAYVELSLCKKYLWKADNQPCWCKCRWNEVSVKAMASCDDRITDRKEWIIE